MTSSPPVLTAIEQAGVAVRSGMPGRALSTFAIGGDCTLVEPIAEAQLVQVMQLFHAEGVAPQLLGAGSNLLIPDEGIRVPVVRLGHGFNFVKQLDSRRFEVGGAVSLMRLSRNLSDMGFSGLEFAGGIPASLGGAVRMNAGAHGGEIATILERVRCVLADGTTQEYERKDLQCAYRYTSIPAGALIVSTVIQLTPGDRGAITTLRARYLDERKTRQPLALPSAGSVFRNPSSERPAGKLLDACGMKGAREGGAAVSTLHANWIVNPERKARASDVRRLIAACQSAAKERHGIDLHPEIVIWE